MNTEIYRNLRNKKYLFVLLGSIIGLWVWCVSMSSQSTFKTIKLSDGRTLEARDNRQFQLIPSSLWLQRTLEVNIINHGKRVNFVRFSSLKDLEPNSSESLIPKISVESNLYEISWHKKKGIYLGPAVYSAKLNL